MYNNIFDLIFSIVGLLLIIFSKQFASKVIKNQNKAWGFQFGRMEISYSVVFSRLIGIAFLVAGVLGLLNILN